MNTTNTSISLDADSRVRLYRGTEVEANHVSLYIEPSGYGPGSSVGLVLGFTNGHVENAAFLRRLAAEINDLARECSKKADVEMLRHKLLASQIDEEGAS